MPNIPRSPLTQKLERTIMAIIIHTVTIETHYLLYLLRAKYHTTNPQANTNTTLAARLVPTIVPRGIASFLRNGGSETEHT